MVSFTARRLLGVVALWLGCAIAAQAQSVNDHWEGRRLITSLPYSFTETTAETSGVDATDPPAPCRYPTQNAIDATVWWGYTSGASTEYLSIEIGNLSFYGNVAVYTGTPGTFRAVSGGCSIRGSMGDRPRIVGMRLPPNTAISIVISSDYPINPGQVIPISVSATPIVNVTKTQDTRDGVCDADCSLREAIDVANSIPVVVLVPAGTYTLMRTGTDEQGNDTGDLDLHASMGLYGAGMQTTIIDAAGIDRVLDIDATGLCCHQYALGDFRLTNGRTFLSPSGNERSGGGLRAQTENCYIGLERVQIDHSEAINSGGGLFSYCPGSLRQGIVASNNANQYGGGVYYFDDPQRAFDIEDSEIVANHGGVGGGIHASARLLVSNSTIHHNLADVGGGGINQGNHRMVLANSTVMYNRGSNNQSATLTGGGIRLDAGSGNVIANSVIARNTTANPNTAADCAINNSNFISRYNHVGAPGACMFGGTGDVSGSDPGLATDAANNGGATGTFAVPLTAAVLDAGDPAGCTDARGVLLVNDQRGAGYPRQLGSACDKGALERSPVPVPGAPDLAAANDSGALDNDNITNAASLTFAGTCVGATTIRLFDGVADLGTMICTSGAYGFMLTSPLSEGNHAFAVDAGDGISTSTRSDLLAVTIDRTAPAAPTIAGPTQSEPLTVTVTGTAAEPLGDLMLLRGPTLLCTTAVTATSTWGCDATFAQPGIYSIDALQVDIAGNVGTVSAPFVIRVGDVLFADGFEG